MKKFNKTLAATAAALSFVLGSPAFAQMTMDHGKMDMAAAPGMTDGEVRKIDKETGKITIKHGEIKHMDMPPMTMVFVAKDKALLNKVQVGEKVKFVVVHEAGKMLITEIEAAK